MLTADNILEYLRDELQVKTDGVDSGTLLFSSGVIDSFGLVQIIAYVEERCRIRFAADDVNLENLDSIERILSLVERSAGR